ncbi:extracellular calcium-sensing receptor-like [Bombina bombina]|uniref:extracellular calcium-sensing receptor-like n=1 Tax=Bombina bombina TaxID=8345 RepID=UPI00235AA983|nr:extracellular calcium-sensing receptor-like [Bombina bombina]
MPTMRCSQAKSDLDEVRHPAANLPGLTPAIAEHMRLGIAEYAISCSHICFDKQHDCVIANIVVKKDKMLEGLLGTLLKSLSLNEQLHINYNLQASLLDSLEIQLEDSRKYSMLSAHTCGLLNDKLSILENNNTLFKEVVEFLQNLRQTSANVKFSDSTYGSGIFMYCTKQNGFIQIGTLNTDLPHSLKQNENVFLDNSDACVTPSAPPLYKKTYSDFQSSETIPVFPLSRPPVLSENEVISAEKLQSLLAHYDKISKDFDDMEIALHKTKGSLGQEINAKSDLDSKLNYLSLGLYFVKSVNENYKTEFSNLRNVSNAEIGNTDRFFVALFVASVKKFDYLQEWYINASHLIIPGFGGIPHTGVNICLLCSIDLLSSPAGILHDDKQVPLVMSDNILSCDTSSTIGYCNNQGCGLKTTELSGMFVTGDIVIGGVFPIHVDKIQFKSNFTEKPSPAICEKFRFENYQRVQALRFAVEEINYSQNLLPNITLGFHIYDSCTVLQRVLAGTLQLLTGYVQPVPNYWCHQHVPMAAFIGHSISTYSMLIAHILGLYRYPQISHFSTSSLLSDRTQFPSFFRTVPSDAFQSQGLAQLLLHFGWTWVGLVAIDNDYGHQGIQVIKKEILKAGACVAFTEYIMINQTNRNAPHIVSVINESTAKAVLFFSTDIDLVHILDEMLRQNVTGKVWVASEAWATSPFLSVDRFSKFLSGTIGFALHSGSMPGFGKFLNMIHPSITPGEDWLKLFWEEAFSCKFPEQENFTDPFDSSSIKQCTGDENLESTQNSYNDVSGLRVSYNVYMAIYLVATALHNMITCRNGKGPFLNGTCTDIWNFKPWQLLYYMKKVHVKMGAASDLYFNENGDPPAVYDIVNWQLSQDGKIKQIKVGSYTSDANGSTFTINASIVQWSTGGEQVPLSVCSESCVPGFRKAAIRGHPVCCFQCVPCPHGEISNQTDSVDCFKCPWDMWPNIKLDCCLPKFREYLSYDDPLGVTLAATSFTSSLVPVAVFGLFLYYKTTPIVRANNYILSCIILLSLSLCFLCSLAFIGYPQREKCLLRQVAFGIVFSLCVSCILAKTIMVVIAFKATKPGSSLRKWSSPRVSYLIVLLCILFQTFICVMWISFSPPFPEQNTRTKSEVIVVECNEGSPFAFWCMLGYLSLLATVSFIVAFLARRLPDSFNEARFITFSMLAFLTVWVSYIPASLSARGKYTAAMEIFAIVSSSWALVIFMFVPKCFIILCRPDMNAKENLIRKYRL